ncbi:meiotic W68 isoform X2 [Oratosquilla oratoria]|uniref:meiotic W68 isoform X2 n=1 Tax=Oratosquilla oratoria TaxID=337810 RepID=UPI003F77110F
MYNNGNLASSEFWYEIDHLCHSLRLHMVNPSGWLTSRVMREKDDRVGCDDNNDCNGSDDRKLGSNGSEMAVVSLATRSSARRFALLMNTLAHAHALINTNTFSTRRAIYYAEVGRYGNQSSLDRSVEDAARLLRVPQRVLHFTTTGKGLAAGALCYTTREGTTFNLEETQNGVLLPECISGLSGITSDAHFILVVEKDATFQTLLDEQFHVKYGPLIMITGKGYPDVSTRLFVNCLHNHLGLPVLALTDADPYGIHIAAVYKFGSQVRPEAGLCVESLVWLGVLPEEIEELCMPPQSLLPLTSKDRTKLHSLAHHPHLSSNSRWMKQIEILQYSGHKAEIQSLTHISPDFLTTIYLPTKISRGNWIV